MKEEWRDIKGYEGRYQVSNLGRVRSWVCSRGKRKSPWRMRGKIDRYGYQVVCLSLNGKSHHLPVHRLVALAFIPNLDNKETVNHRSGDKLDNRAQNLEWATRSEQELHKYRVLGCTPLGFSKEYMEKRKRKVLCVETGAEYESAAEAQRNNPICNSSSILKVCKNKKHHKTVHGLHWRYV